MHSLAVPVLPPSATVHDAAVTMRDQRRCAVLVMTGGRLEGIFTEQDVVRRVVAERRDPATVALAEVMTRHPDTIEADAPAIKALQMMEEGRYRHLPVVHQGQVIGLVSRLDFLGEEKAALETQRHLKETLW